MTVTFVSKLEELEALIQEPPNEEVVKTLVHYAMGFIDGRTFRKIDRRYDYDGVLAQFRREHLEANYYIMGKLWRATYAAVLGREVTAADFGVTDEDVELCLSYLGVIERKKIREWVMSHDYVFLPQEVVVNSIVIA